MCFSRQTRMIVAKIGMPKCSQHETFLLNKSISVSLDGLLVAGGRGILCNAMVLCS